MMNHLIQALYEKVTGTPYYTTRTASIEFGPPPAALHRDRLSRLRDDQAHAEWERLKPIRVVAHVGRPTPELASRGAQVGAAR